MRAAGKNQISAIEVMFDAYTRAASDADVTWIRLWNSLLNWNRVGTTEEPKNKVLVVFPIRPGRH